MKDSWWILGTFYSSKPCSQPTSLAKPEVTVLSFGDHGVIRSLQSIHEDDLIRPGACLVGAINHIPHVSLIWMVCTWGYFLLAIWSTLEESFVLQLCISYQSEMCFLTSVSILFSEMMLATTHVLKTISNLGEIHPHIAKSCLFQAKATDTA